MKQQLSFTAIDFETATYVSGSACALGLVTVQDGQVIDTWYSLIRPPRNEYHPRMIEIHGITAADTSSAGTFADLYPEIRQRVRGQRLVAHNSVFDRGVLEASMACYHLPMSDLQLIGWDCTLRMYRKRGFRPANLAACAARMGIPLNHHNALSDARVCAELFLRS